MWRQWHRLDNMHIICTSLQTGNDASTSSLNFYRPDALSEPQQCQSTKGKLVNTHTDGRDQYTFRLGYASCEM